MIIVNLTEEMAHNKADWKEKMSMHPAPNVWDKGFVVVVAERC